MSKPGILTVSASTGRGHLRAGAALREAAAEAHPDLPVAVAREGGALAGQGVDEMRAAFRRACTEPAPLPRLGRNARRIGPPAAARPVLEALARGAPLRQAA